MRNCFEDTTPDAIKEARPKGAGNTDEPLDITRTQEVQGMPVEAHISPIGDSANSYLHHWRDARSLRRALVGAGWKTPNTYDNCFSDPISGSAVYLFLLHGWDSRDNFHDFDKALVAYVGMSKRLKNRWQAHPILREIEATGRYVQKWFRAEKPLDLRAEEFGLIQKFDPPWNIQGRKRGALI